MATDTVSSPVTFDRLRSPLLREIDAAYVDAVKRGVAFMDEKYGPDWAKDHSDEFLHDFNIDNASHCVLGIMGRGESRRGDDGYHHLLDKWGLDDDSFYGFCLNRDRGIESWTILQRTWEIALQDLIKY